MWSPSVQHFVNNALLQKNGAINIISAVETRGGQRVFVVTLQPTQFWIKTQLGRPGKKCAFQTVDCDFEVAMEHYATAKTCIF